MRESAWPPAPGCLVLLRRGDPVPGWLLRIEGATRAEIGADTAVYRDHEGGFRVAALGDGVGPIDILGHGGRVSIIGQGAGVEFRGVESLSNLPRDVFAGWARSRTFWTGAAVGALAGIAVGWLV